MKTTKSTMITTLITSEDDSHTYEVRKEAVGGKSKIAVVIMLYPSISSATIKHCDNTTQSIIDHMEDIGVGTVRIINLFSKVCSARMSTRSIKLDQENLKYIEGVMKEKVSSEVIWVFAWGSSMSACAVANQMKRMIINLMTKYLTGTKPQQFTVDGLDMKNEKAIHPLFLKIRHGNTAWKLDEYIIPKDLLEVPAKGIVADIKDIKKEKSKNVLQNSK